MWPQKGFLNAPAQKKPACSFEDQKLKSKLFSANIQGQQIDVIGWHHGTVERDVAQLTMADALNDGLQR